VHDVRGGSAWPFEMDGVSFGLISARCVILCVWWTLAAVCAVLCMLLGVSGTCDCALWGEGGMGDNRSVML